MLQFDRRASSCRTLHLHSSANGSRAEVPGSRRWRGLACGARIRETLVRGLFLLALSVAWPVCLGGSAYATGAQTGDVILYRVFLLDGTNAVSYGEFARIAGNVVFSMPLGGLDTEAPKLQLVSLSESAVDWPRTEAYAEAARARRFVETRAEAEFSRLSEAVAMTLNQVANTREPAKRLAIADQARRMLADWPAQNYAYRAGDVAQLAALLDEVVSELRVAAGQSRFELNLVASTSPPPAVPMMPPPTLRESVEQAFMLARSSGDASQRASLLTGINEALATPAAEGGWAAALRARANSELILAKRTDRAYSDLSARTIKLADERARRADVKGLEALIRDVLKADDKLGRQRPQETAALLATMDLRVDTARRTRLAADQWAASQGVVRAYERKARPALDVLGRVRPSLEQIRQLAGPSPGTLRQLQKNAGIASREFALIKPAPETDAVHGLLMNAFQMAIRAADTRLSAVSANDMALAWQASSAAAGALLLLDRARDELKRLTTPPVQ
jgi:hypothetical protein